jgi:hypothetical protein
MGNEKMYICITSLRDKIKGKLGENGGGQIAPERR